MPVNTATHSSRQPSNYALAEIDFQANMETVLSYLYSYINQPFAANPFWEQFKALMAEAEKGPATEKLFLVHDHTYYIAELFEDYDDLEALEALARLEQQCF
jgi:hypothetical protein